MLVRFLFSTAMQSCSVEQPNPLLKRGVFICFPIFIMENLNVIHPEVTLSRSQLQAIEANRLPEVKMNYEEFQKIARGWRISEAENTRLRYENRKLRQQRSIIQRIRRLVHWASSPKPGERTSIPGFEMELTVFGLTAVMGMANVVSYLLA